MAALSPAFVGVRVAAPRRAGRAASRRGAVCVRASAAFIKVLTISELKEKNGRAVVEVNGKPVLLQELEGEIYAVRATRRACSPGAAWQRARLARCSHACAERLTMRAGLQQVPTSEPVHARQDCAAQC